LIQPVEQIFDFTGLDGGINNGGGGGGGLPTVAPPPYVPTNAVETSKSLNFYLKTNNGESVQFLVDGVSYGIGPSTNVTYNPSTSFGSVRQFTAVTNSGKVLSRFEVRIVPFTSYDNTYAEGIRVIEWRNDVEQAPKTFNTTFGTYTLEFFVEAVNVQPVQPIEQIQIEPTTITNPNPNVNYQIVFGSNFDNEIGKSLSLKYDILNSEGIIIESNKISGRDLGAGQIPRSVLSGGKVNIEVSGNLPNGFSVSGIYSGLSRNAGNDLSFEYDKLTKQNYAFSIPASSLGDSLVVLVKLEKIINVAEPKLILNSTQYNVFVKESDTEKELTIPFDYTNADLVRLYFSETEFIEVPASNKSLKVYFQKNFKEQYGTKKVILVPIGNAYGTGTRSEILITFTSVNDYPSITDIVAVDKLDVPVFSDYNLEYEVSYTTYSTTSVDVWLKTKNGEYVVLSNGLPSNGSFKINLKTLKEKYPNWDGSDNVTLKFKPYNRGGAEELIGNEYEITTLLNLPSIYLDESMINSALFESFASALNIIEPPKESKYLTHLANFGDDEQFLISSWENDNWTLSKKSEDELGNIFVKPEDEVKSIILKLYSPLSANIINNSTFWVTKLMANPLVETVVLTNQDELKCPPLKGPNFNLDVDYVSGQSTNFESLDTLILSASVSSSSQLVSKYLSSSFNDTTDLNIQYASGSTYLWENFVHFSSAKERLDNFVYKVQLIEVYEQSISASYYNPAGLSHTASISAVQERERQQLKKDQLVNGFDGFESFLYTSSSVYTTNDSASITWPYSGSVRLESSNLVVSNWYNNVVTLAEYYDIHNSNWVQNNIPQYIVNNEENDQFLLFLSMIGQHFDNIYYYTKAIERSRGLGYNSINGISDKLLYDTLKSFGWEAQNLAADANLWKYVFGQDSEGNTAEVNPAKQRTNEVWKRIVNNLPYLLKHKGTRRGIYALLACYGIPSSNLSILEFGGPEIHGSPKSKYEFDNITTALKMISGSYIEMEWKDTDKGRKPNTIELFIKPTKSSEVQTVISGSGWNLQLSGSTDSEYGKVSFNFSGSTAITSSLLPIFNGNFFGVMIHSGSEDGMQLSLRQANKDRTIFEEAASNNSVSNWNNGSTIRLGGNYTGSVDEFRLWSDVLANGRFYEHVSFPEMINGNHTSSSTDDLYFRLDFEYPKNLALTSSLINVDTNIYFENGYTRNDYENGVVAQLYSTNASPLLSASAYFPNSITTYPYQFEAIDRSVVLVMPDAGSSRYSTNKVRFESQTLVSDLSAKSRATKKAYDQSPVDSNRVGLFFSPTKELNIDIAKSFGGINLDDYIGDPSDKYKSSYKRLDDLRNYYFQRFDNRDIYSYINLIKLYEKSMFEDIKKMLPARVKATTGLLIEPHILERSKIAQKKPTGEEYQNESVIDYADTTITTAENNQYDTLITNSISEDIVGENQQYDALIVSSSTQSTIAENYQYDTQYDYYSSTNTEGESYQKEVVINAELENPTILTEVDIYDMNTVVGQTDYESIGFGLYAQNGYAIRNYFNAEGIAVKERVKVDLIKERKTRDIVKFNVVVGGQGDPRGGTQLTSSVYYETSLNIQPFSGSKVINAGTGSIVEVTPLSGYLPTHHRNTSDLTTGLRNSYYLGSKNTAATTLDGSPPIETFVSNPNTLKVNKTNRGADEPILETE
jgi:hypothetical protein